MNQIQLSMKEEENMCIENYATCLRDQCLALGWVYYLWGKAMGKEV